MQILIAEDDDGLSHLLATQVRVWGYDPVVVHDGLSALEVLQTSTVPRLALLDLQMPGLDGIEVCRRLRAEPDDSYPYLILLTGQGGRQEMLDGLDAGADEFLAKPVDHAELKARLNAGRRIVAMHQQLCDQATRDALTGVWNRAAILGLLEKELDRGRREGRPVGVALADLDHFKRINDTLGHLAGDAVLSQTAQRMLGTLRPYDAVGRYGGEEFLIVLPGCDRGPALALADRLCQHVAADPIIAEGRAVGVTLSLGVTSWEPGLDWGVRELLRAADVALYAAKDLGRNCARLAAAPAVAVGVRMQDEG